MASVAVNPPKTPCTKGSNSVAAATLPNVCKMPGPPAPFVPTPLPNIGKSDNSPDGFSSTVKIEGNIVAIRGASFKSMGDVASQGTGGGLVSNNTQGPTKFVAPGAMDVQIEGKNVQLLSDQMLNNCGPSGSPANAATMGGLLHVPAPGAIPPELTKIARKCDNDVNSQARSRGATCQQKGSWKHKCCADHLRKRNYSNVKVESSCGHANSRLDVAVVNAAGAPLHIFDFKFPCTRPKQMSPTQRRKYATNWPGASITVV